MPKPRTTGRPAGRPPGRKNNRTVERETIAARELAVRELALAEGDQRIMTARRAGQKLGREVLEDLMNLGMGLVATFQPHPPVALEDGTIKNPNKFYDDDKFRWAADFTQKCASDLASYQSPKLKAVLQAQAPAPSTLPGENGKVIGRIGDPSRVYRQMIAKVG